MQDFLRLDRLRPTTLTLSCTEGLQKLYEVKDTAFYSEYEITSERCIHVFVNKLIYLMYTCDTMGTLNHSTQS